MSDNYEAKFFEQYGRSIAEWSALENALSHWFGYATITALNDGQWGSNTNLYPALKVYNSARSFDGKIAMLNEAFSAVRREPSLSAFFKAAIKLAREYSIFRNNLAHHLTINKIQARQMELQHLDDAFGRKPVIRQPDLESAVRNFENLTRLLLFTFPQTDVAHAILGKRAYSASEALELLKTFPKKAGEPPVAKIPFPSF